ncbi:hypothetical protein [Paraburkholderia dipogonis]|jgi:hypothetical protein|uniref:hypothetical protein n=1 Tax=Paraburkholderia dipogonis TaxID=1211383 RepID=UPI0038B79A6E
MPDPPNKATRQPALKQVLRCSIYPLMLGSLPDVVKQRERLVGVLLSMTRALSVAPLHIFDIAALELWA